LYLQVVEQYGTDALRFTMATGELARQHSIQLPVVLLILMVYDGSVSATTV
jgi:hypothetical protein